MAYVRSLRYEQVSNNKVIRVYVVETPRWYLDLEPYERCERFPKLVELELHISRECSEYFRKVPYSLAEAIWKKGLTSLCGRAFCGMSECAVLYYRKAPAVSRIVELDTYHTAPVVLQVTFSSDT
jgi:hypothetical protein